MTFLSPDREIRNAVEEAVYWSLGGVREVAKLLDCATQSVYEHLGRGLIRNREVALEYERLTREAGRPVPATELMDLVPWQGPARMGGPGRGKRGPNGSSPRPASVAKLPTGGGTEAGTHARADARKTRTRKASQRPVKPRDISGIWVVRSPYPRVGQRVSVRTGTDG